MIGKTVSHYKILSKLAEGGMGIIYKAQDLTLQREVALKFLPPDITSDPETKQRFVHEAQAASKLDHPNICTIHEIQETESGQMFIAMAYYKGETLKQKMETGSLSLEQTLDIGIQVTEGLARAHEGGIIHRDIKPANIMITNRGEVKILDFGLAKLTGKPGLTREGIAVGTAAYMSPEQASGEQIDHRTDIWSIGVILFEIVCKKLPFQGDTPRSIVYSIISKEPAGFSDCEPHVSEEYKTVVTKCMSKDKKKRYQKVSDLQVDLILLKRSLMKQKVTEKIKSTPVRISPLKRFKPILIPMAAILLVAVILLLFPSTGSMLRNWLGMGDGFREKQVAILFLEHDKGDSKSRAYYRGLVVRMTQKLMMLEKYEKKLWVVPSRFLLKEEVDSVNKANTVFKVNLVVTGNITRTGNTISLILNLVNSENNNILKSERFADHITNLTVWQEGVILKLAEFLNLELTPDTEALLSAGNTSFPGAFNLYLQGCGSCIENCSKKEIDQAIHFFTRALEQDDSYADAYAMLGKSYLHKYRSTNDSQWIEKGLNACNRAIQINNLLGWVYLNMGKIYREAGQYDLAIQKMQKALNGNQADFYIYMEMASAYQGWKKLYKVEEMYKKSISLRPDYWFGYAHLGYFYHSTGRLNEAEEMYSKAVELNPVNVRSFNALISIYNRKGDNLRAYLMFKRSIAAQPTSAAYSNMGNNLFYQGRYADARKMYEEAIRLGRKDRRIWGNLADSYRYSGEHKKQAQEVYQQAVELSRKELLNTPRNASVHSSLGLYLSKLGKYSQAIQETEIALKLEPNNLTIIYNAMLVFEISGRRSRALDALDDYIERHGSIAVFSRDPDLSKLRNDLRYKKRLEKPGKSGKNK
jgi:serine/threonine protein kinase/tetratricopeptide (TPR) repeat protein